HALGWIIAGMWILSAGGTVYNISQVSFRQAITPNHMLGRTNATMRFMVWGTMPLGSLTGGLLGSVLGLRTTLVIAALGGMLSVLWVLAAPVRLLDGVPVVERDQP
ncbi:MAG: hypothetical protein QOH10_1811, partial [Actinomycetota bacterium]|nr:hypothetical protein [Actinomycetota bacterium]